MQNEVWEMYHTQLDSKGLWLTFVEDTYSRSIAGYRFHSSQPTANISALCLRSAILSKDDPRWYMAGIPSTVFFDHERGALGPLLTNIERVAIDLSIEVRFLHSSQSNRDECFLSQAAQFVSHTEAISLLALAEQFQTWLLESYHRQIHLDTGETPKERWQAAFIPRRPRSVEQLDPLLCEVPRTRRVQPRYVQFAGQRYEHDLFSDYAGENVQVFFDPADMAEIRIYFDGEFLCRAICPTLAGRTVSLNDLRKNT